MSELPNGPILKQYLLRIEEVLGSLEEVLGSAGAGVLSEEVLEECASLSGTLLGQRMRLTAQLGAYDEALVVLGALSSDDLSAGHMFPCLGGYNFKEGVVKWGGSRVLFAVLESVGWERLSAGFKSLGWDLGERQADGSYCLRKVEYPVLG